MLQSSYGRVRRQCFTTDMAIISAWIAVFIPGHLYGWLVERFYSVLLFMIAISVAVAACSSPLNFISRRNKIILMGLLVITVCYIITTILTMVSNVYVTNIRDILDLSRYLIIGGVFIVMGSADPCRLRTAVGKLVLVSLSFSLVVMFLYMVDVPVLSDLAHLLYKDTKTGISFPYRVRLSAPFENPNFLAFYAVLCFSYSLFFTSGKHRIILTALALVVLVLTGSRSGWVAAVILIVGLFTRVLLGVFISTRTILWQDIRFLICFSLVVSCSLWFFYPYFLESSRVQMVLIALEDGGLSHERNVAGRIDMVVEAFRLFAQRPILGWGPLKGGPLDVIDNQYFLVLARQGLVGFILFISIMLYVFAGALKFARTRVEKFGVFLMWFSVALMLMTGAFLNNFRLFVLFIFFVVASATGKSKGNEQRVCHSPTLPS